MSYDNPGLRRLEENLRGLSSTQQVPLTEMLSPAFMQHHTQFASFEAMLAASPFPVESAEDFKAIPEWDAFVLRVTRFHSWEAMQKEAGVEWVKQQLLKGIK